MREVNIKETFEYFLECEIEGSETLKPHQKALLEKCFYGGIGTVLGALVVDSDKGKPDQDEVRQVAGTLKALLSDVSAYAKANYKNHPMNKKP